MREIYTKYGVIRGVSSLEFYHYGQVKECTLNQYNEIDTFIGKLVPQYGDEETRRKYIRSLSFYENGNIKSISLHRQTPVKTTVGKIEAELITFYDNECIKKIFPLNGKITGYWTEENEYELAKEQKFIFPFGGFSKKIISLLFYKSGEIKSITLWPKEKLTLITPVGLLDIRTGISMYKNGQLKSVEPEKPTLINTPIGKINAYDSTVIGINGDKNSLMFHDDKTIKSLKTSTDQVEVINKYGEKDIFKPNLKPNLFNNHVMDIVPLLIEFDDNKIRFNNDQEKEYDISQYSFVISHNVRTVIPSCGSCSDCAAC